MSLPYSLLMKRLTAVLLSVVLATAANLSLAEPRKGRPGDEPSRRQEEPARARISPPQAAAIVQREYGGQVMNVTSYNRNGGTIHGVKILQESGRMRTVNVDGQTGNILN